MTNKLLEIIGAKYPLAEVDVKDMATLKANGMKFAVSAYKAEGLGHISVMRAKGFFGLMKMDTLIVNPYEVDLPLYSYDRIYAAGNDTLIVELYDTMAGEFSEDKLLAVNAAYADLPERDPGEHWYDSIKLASSISKKGKKAETSRFDEMTVKHLEAYLSAGEGGSVVDAPSGAGMANGLADDISSKKHEKALYYVNGLLENGGPSTDVFKKALGEDVTRELFEKVLFGV